MMAIRRTTIQESGGGGGGGKSDGRTGGRRGDPGRFERQRAQDGVCSLC